VVKVAEAVGGVVIVVPVDIQLLNPVVNILAKLHISVCGTTTFIFVGWDVDPEALQIRKAISCDQDFCSFSLNHLDALVVISWTHLTPIPPIVKVIESTAGMSANADIADESVLKTCFEGRYGRKEEKRQSKHHVSQRRLNVGGTQLYLWSFQLCNS